jgi:hypothetical protein
MDLEMTIPEACFQAEDATDCYAAWHTYVSDRFLSPAIAPMLLAEAVSMMTKEKFEEHSLRFLNMSILNLFLLQASVFTIYQCAISDLTLNWGFIPYWFNRRAYSPACQLP